jgi:cytosine/adenosine deaminase-related metal-dependent hydrolase
MIFTCSKLLTCRPRAQFIKNGAIVVDRGAILSVGTEDNVKKRFSNHRVIRLPNMVLMPGLVNLHTHIELPPLLERVYANTFPDWIINLIRAKKYLSRKEYQRATRININTLIQTGTTTVGEICTHGVSPALLRQNRLRAVIYHEIISMNPNQGEQWGPQPGLPSRSSLLMQAGLSPHTPYTVSQSVLHAISRLSQKKGFRVSMHIAESKEETRLLQRKRSGLEELYRLAGWDIDWAPHSDSSFEYLKGIGFLSPNLLAVHAVQVTEKDIESIRKSRVSIAHCPRSNKETRVGKMPLKKFLDAGIIVGLGTDSLASSPSLSLWDEMRYAYQIHRRSGISAADIFQLATINGAKALGLDTEIGTLEPGKIADMIAVPLPLKNTGDIYSDLLRDTKSCIMSMVNGKILYRDISG